MKTFNFLHYSEKLRWRIRLLTTLLVLMVIYMIVVAELGGGDSRIMTPLASAISRIIFFGGMIWVIYRIIHNKRLLANSLDRKMQRLQEQDERNQLLHNKSGGIVWDLLFFCLLIITCTTALFNMPAFYTSLSILTLALIFKLTAYFFYSHQS